ncbi:S22A6 protein, partial [Polypterus senegalus]
MAFLDLLDNIGGLGLFQLLNAILLTIPGFLTACHALLQNFSAAIPDHHCRIPNQTSTVSHWTFSFSELSNKSILKAFIPLEKNNNPSKCERYLNPQWTLLILNETTHHKINQTTEKCQDGWDYDRREFLETIVSEWDLVCSRKPLKQMSQTVYMGGVLAGAIILGRLSDKWIPESARWLVLNNHYDKAVREIQRVARINHLPEEGKKITVEVNCTCCTSQLFL